MTLSAAQSGSGIPVVFLHAFPLDRRMWAPQESFAKHFRFISVDFPGFGESPIGIASSMESMGRAVMKTLDGISLREKAVFVGLSMGGYVLFQIARIFPDRIRAAAFISTRSGADTPEGRQKRLENIEIVKKQGVNAFLEKAIPGLLGETTHKERPEVFSKVRSLAATQTADGIIAALTGMAERPDTSTVLDGLQCPALFVAGAEDTIIKSAEMEAMSKRVKNSEFHLVEKAGHLLSLERPDALEDLLNHFLKRRVL
jgi:3-oxoadipate enol-lactonase